MEIRAPSRHETLKGSRSAFNPTVENGCLRKDSVARLPGLPVPVAAFLSLPRVLSAAGQSLIAGFDILHQ